MMTRYKRIQIARAAIERSQRYLVEQEPGDMALEAAVLELRRAVRMLEAALDEGAA